MRVLAFSPMTRFAMQHYLQCIINQCERDNIDLTLLLPNHAKFISSGKVHLIGGGGKLGVLWANINPLTYVKLARVMLRGRFDVVHVLNGEGRLTTLWLMILCRILGIRSVISAHDPEPHPCATVDKFTYQLGRLSIFFACEINIHDRAHVPIVRAWGKPIHVFPFPDIATLFRKAPTVSRENAVLFFGRIEPYKGLRNFVDLGIQMSGRAKFIIAGSGSIDKETRRLIELNQEIFEVHNRFVPDEEMIDFFDRSMVVVLPYESATQSGIPAGAASRGAVPIGFAVGGLINQLPEVGGIAVPATDMGALEAAVRCVLDGKYERHFEGPDTSERFAAGLIKMYCGLPNLSATQIQAA